MILVPTILVIEHDHDTARLIAEFLGVLSAPPFQVATMRTAAEALTVPPATRVDCIVLDCDLECNGPHCMPDIRGRWPNLPAIVITGFGSEELAVSALKEYGATDYIPKRGNYLPKLLHCVRNGLGRAVFREEGSAWRIGYRGCEAEFRALKGFRYIHGLLQNAGHSVPATRLAGDCAASLVGASTAVACENGMRIRRDLGDPGYTLDREAFVAYRARLHQLANERCEAHLSGDDHTESKLDAEVDDLQKELRRALRGGKRDSGHRDRARVCVSKGIDLAVETIDDRLPGLADHLHAQIRKGYDCIYIPDPSWSLEWHL